MARSIKLSDGVMSNIEEECTISSRSLAGQAEHWIRIGQAIENSPNFSYQHIRQALKGEIATSELSAEEQEVFFDEFAESMWETTPEQEQDFQDYIAKH